MAIYVVETAAYAYRLAAGVLCQAAADSINMRGTFRVAVGAGPDVEAVLSLLSTERLRETSAADGSLVWGSSVWFLAEAGHRRFLEPLGIRAEWIHDRCTWEALVSSALPSAPPEFARLDLVLLGPDEDGEIRGMPEGSPVLDEDEPCIVNDAHRALVISTGEKGAREWERACRCESLIRPGGGAGVCWVLDRQAEALAGSRLPPIRGTTRPANLEETDEGRGP